MRAVPLLGICSWVAITTAWTQEAAPPVRLSGSVAATAEAYTSSGDAPTQRFLPRYGARFFVRPVLHLFGKVEVPFELSFATNVGLRSGYPIGFQQPFNQFGLSPQITSWLRLHGGWFSLRLSELSFGELRLLGGGIELSPGVFRFRALYGVVQQPRPLDTASGFPGAYRRWTWGGSIGFVTEGGTEVLLHYARLLDDTTSIRLARVVRDTLLGRTDTIVTPAQDNAIAALSFRIPLGQSVTVQGEAALSAYSSSLRAPEKGLGIPRWLFTPRYSSNLDGAATLGLTVTPSQAFSLSVNGRWIGPGFYSLGYPQLVNDVAEVTLAPSMSLAENRVRVQMSAGLQWNNLRNTRLGTTRRFIGSVGLGWQPSQQIGVDVQYANYGTRMDHENDTLRVRNVYQNVSVAPRFQFSGLGGTNMVLLSYTFSQTDDQNPLSRAASQQRSHTGMLSHSLLLPSSLSFSTTLNATTATTGSVQTKLWMASEAVSYALIPRRLTSAFGLSFSRMYTIAWDTQWSLRLTLAYSLQQWGTLTWNTFLNRSERSGRRPFTEVQSSLNYGLSF